MKKKDLKNNISYKIYRRLHYWFWNKVNPGNWSLYLYSAYRHYKFSRGNNKSVDKNDLYLTLEPNRGAGIGHQMGNWLAGYCLAEKFGVRYAYARFPSAEWDEFLGFGEYEISAEELLARGYVKRRLPGFHPDDEERWKLIESIINSYQGKRVLFYLSLDQYYRNIQEAETYIKEKFNHAKARKNDKLIYEQDTLNIAMHIRRGDIVEGQMTLNPQLTQRWLNTEYYVKVLRDVISTIPQKKKYQIYLFSQGTPQDFPELRELPNLTYCLDMSAKESFLHMVKADILLTSKSSFSYKPALLSEGIKICPKDFWHGYPLGKEWILIDEIQNLSDEQINFLRKRIGDILCRN